MTEARKKKEIAKLYICEKLQWGKSKGRQRKCDPQEKEKGKDVKEISQAVQWIVRI